MSTSKEIQDYLIANIKHLSQKNFAEAAKVLTFDNVQTTFENEKTKTITGGSKITDLELQTILSIADEHFPDSAFKNADIAPLIPKLTARQTPSRLKKLVDQGYLEDLGGSPKSYKVVK